MSVSNETKSNYSEYLLVAVAQTSTPVVNGVACSSVPTSPVPI